MHDTYTYDICVYVCMHACDVIYIYIRDTAKNWVHVHKYMTVLFVMTMGPA